MIRNTAKAIRPARTIVVSCLKRQQCACASAAAGPSRMHAESDSQARDRFAERFENESSFRESIAYSLSFGGGGSLEDDLHSDDFVSLIDDRMKRQLELSYNALLSPSDSGAQQLRSRLPPELKLNSSGTLANASIKRNLPPLEEEDEEVVMSANYHVSESLPKTVTDISPSNLDKDVRPIVVTETKNPYRIVAVNTAWEGLCGYQRDECQGRPLGQLVQGPETDKPTVSALLSKLLAGEEAGAMLTNYTKHGRKFKNNVRVRPIVDEMGKTVNFVGVLREVNGGEDNNMISSYGGDVGKLQLPFMA